METGEALTTTMRRASVASIASTMARVPPDAIPVTCMVDQSYRLAGEPVSVTAPMTVVYVREASQWKVALVSAAPLPEEAA